MQLESLESRYAFCADLAEFAGVSESELSVAQAEGEQVATPFYGPMPVEYYAQFPELPATIPVAGAVGVTEPSPALVDAALTSTDPTSEGEGEGGATYNGIYSVSRGKPPRIVEFDFKPSFLGGIRVFGYVEDEDGPVANLPVSFSGALEGRATTTTPSGYFYLYIPQNELRTGLAKAQATDLNGYKSDVSEVYIR